METSKNHEITITNEVGETMTLIISAESDIYEWARNLRVILKWLTFDDKLIEEILPENEEL